MATRQLRLNTPEQIREKLTAHSGKKINIVLRDRTVFFGELRTVDHRSLKFANMRDQEITLPLSHISEVYFDF